ncbi:hypothetical protein LguiA_000602 [Lonicera macranthoides]
MPIYSSDSDYQNAPAPRLFGRQRPLYSILGGGKLADIILWREKNLSAAILIGVTMFWFLFQVVEYNFVSLICHISILIMLIVFIWSSGATLAYWSPPDIRDLTVPESSFRWLLAKFNRLLLKFCEISSGKDFTHFFLAVASLWILSVLGNYFSSINLLYLGFLCMETIPALYERYEREVDHLVIKGNQDAKKLYKKFDANVLTKIPRGPVKQNKFR